MGSYNIARQVGKWFYEFNAYNFIQIKHIGTNLDEHEECEDMESDAVITDSDSTLMDRILDSQPATNIGKSAAVNQGMHNQKWIITISSCLPLMWDTL